MYRRGIVSEVDPDTVRARVKFPDKGDVQSFWLEVLQSNTFANKDQRLPDVGELVVVLMDEKNTAGCILGAIYTAANKPPEPSQDVRRVTFSDGAVVEYNRASHTLLVSGAALVRVTGEGVQVELDGSVKVKGGASPVALANKVATALNALKGAIAGAAVVPADGGAAFKAAVVAALASWPASTAAESLSSD